MRRPMEPRRSASESTLPRHVDRGPEGTIGGAREFREFHRPVGSELLRNRGHPGSVATLALVAAAT